MAYKIPKLAKHKELFHAFSTVDDGNMSYLFSGHEEEKEVVLNRRKKFIEKLGLDVDSCVSLHVQGRDTIAIADPEIAGKSMKDMEYSVKVDALITDRKNLYLFMLTADCVPVILFDPEKGALGIVHVGWKGADLNIVSSAIGKMRGLYGCKPGDLVVGIGPAARKDLFIKETPSQRNDPKWQPFLEKISGDNYKIDFVGLCKRQLINEGVKKDNIHDCEVDTIEDKKYFSHFRDFNKAPEVQGRFACVVGLC